MNDKTNQSLLRTANEDSENETKAESTLTTSTSSSPSSICVDNGDFSNDNDTNYNDRKRDDHSLLREPILSFDNLSLSHSSPATTTATQNDNVNEKQSFHPINAGTSQLGRALLEGDILAALQFLDEEFCTNDQGGATEVEDEFLSVNSLLDNEEINGDDEEINELRRVVSDDGDGDTTLLLDPELYATVFDESERKDDYYYGQNHQDKLGIDNLQEEDQSSDFFTRVDDLQSALHSLKIDTIEQQPFCIPCGEENESVTKIESREISPITIPFNTMTTTNATDNQQEGEGGPEYFDYSQKEEGELSEEDFEVFLQFSQEEEEEKFITFDNQPSQQQGETTKQTPVSIQSSSSLVPNTLPLQPTIKPSQSPPLKQRTCFGHKDAIFGLSFSPCGTYLATASQDSTIRIWDVARNAPIGKPLNGHDKNYKCLRVAWSSDIWGGIISNNDDDNNAIIGKKFFLASAGADGLVKIWQSRDGTCCSWNCVATLDHNKGNSPPEKGNKDKKGNKFNYDETANEEEDDDNCPRIYALQFIDHWKGLPTPRSFTSMLPPPPTTPRSFLSALPTECIKCNDKDNTCESSSVLLTSLGDHIHIWQIVEHFDENENDNTSPPLQQDAKELLTIQNILSFRFTNLERGFGGVFVSLPSTTSDITTKTNDTDSNILFGPSSNNIPYNNILTTKPKMFDGKQSDPANLIYVFDASQCPANNLLGVALSDGTLRLVNGRGVCVSILQLPGCPYLTSLNWRNDGNALVSCVATGHLILWDIHLDDGGGGLLGNSGRGTVRPACRAVLEGGHDFGKPLYGALFCGDGESETIVLSWGADGKLCVWNSKMKGHINSPISTLTSDSSYPIYAVDVIEKNKRKNAIATSSLDSKDDKSFSRQDKKGSITQHVAIGGGRDGSFVDVPVYLYDLYNY